MEFINRVELQGTVGSSRVNQTRTGYVCNLSVATQISYVDINGTPVVAKTWHSVVLFTQSKISFNKGDNVHVLGRIRNNKYTGSDGVEKWATEILASSVEFVR